MARVKKHRVIYVNPNYQIGTYHRIATLKKMMKDSMYIVGRDIYGQQFLLLTESIIAIAERKEYRYGQIDDNLGATETPEEVTNSEEHKHGEHEKHD